MRTNLSFKFSQIFAPWFSGVTLVPNQSKGIQHLESKKKVCNQSFFFSFGQLLVPKNDKVLVFLTEVK